MKKFTEDEKIVARNIDKKYKWIARDADGCLSVYDEKPKKGSGYFWDTPSSKSFQLLAFEHMFKSIKWDDKKPTRIRDIYDPQILDDVEREYLKTILKPFHDKVDGVIKSRDGSKGPCKEYLFIKFCDGDFTFPSFDSGKMYSGMELEKKYKLDELGITYTEDKA